MSSLRKQMKILAQLASYAQCELLLSSADTLRRVVKLSLFRLRQSPALHHACEMNNKFEYVLSDIMLPVN